MNNVNTPKPKSGAPILIMGAVLVIALIGGWWLFSSSKQPVNGNTAANKTPAAAKTPGIPPNAPPGANPPNQSGSPTAQVTLEEFADFQCPQCGLKHPVVNEIKSTYGTRIRFIFRENPLAIPAHDKSYDAAVAAEAAGLQGKFWDMENLLFTNQKAWTAEPTFRQIWKDYATKIGLDVAKWESDIAGLGAKQRVDADLARGKSIPVNSTPTLFINGIEVPFEQFTVSGLRQMIDAELAKAAPQVPAPNAANPPAANSGNTNK